MLPFFVPIDCQASAMSDAGPPASALKFMKEPTCRAKDSALDDAVRAHERHRVAQQIHDDLGGILTGLKACIAVALERRSRAGAEPDPLLLDASVLADLAFATVRNIGTNLRPTVLEEMDLWEALEWQVAGLCRRTDVEFDYFVDAALLSLALGEERAMLVFRVVCEALANVEKHSRASKVSLRLFAERGALAVLVKDNGIGMRHPAEPVRSTFGIAGMKQRAHDIGGEVAVSSGMGCGTLVRLTVPFARGGGD